MKRQLLFQDEKSHKFWTIEVEDNSHTVTYGRVGTQGQSKTKTFDSNKICRKEAEKLINAKLKKGYAEESQVDSTTKQITNSAHTDITVNLSNLGTDTLLQHFDWGDITDGHRNCPQLLEQLQNSDTQTLVHIIDTTLQTFTFVSGGGWMPHWMKALGGKRHHGSGLLFLRDALALLQKKDETAWVSSATRALPYVVCEGEAIDHDEGEAWDIYTELNQSLAPLYQQADKDFAIEQVLQSIALQLRAISTAHVCGDPLQSSVALLQSAIPSDAKLSILDLVLDFLNADFNMISWAISYNGLDEQLCERYAKAISTSQVGDSVTAQIITQLLLLKGEQSEFKNGRPTGSSCHEIYWPAINKEKNDRCPILHFDGNQVLDLGTFNLIPKVMCWTPEGLYFCIKNKIYRYTPKTKAWDIEYDASFHIAMLAYLHGKLCAIGAEPILCCKQENDWRRIELNSTAKFNGIAAGTDDSIWVTGTQGTIRLIKADHSVQAVDAIEKDKKNYRPVTTGKCTYIYCTTGLYRIDTKKPKRIIKKKITAAVAIGEVIYAATENTLLRIEKDKIKSSLPIKINFLAVLGDDLVACVDDKLYLLTEDKLRIILPAAKVSKVVKLPG